MHVHIGVLQGFIVFAFVLLFGTGWRLIALHLSQTPIGQAMAFMY